MNGYITEDASYFDGVDWERPRIKHKWIETMQANARAMGAQEQDTYATFFDDDVLQAIKQHDTPKDRERLNTVIRALFGVV